LLEELHRRDGLLRCGAATLRLQRLHAPIQLRDPAGKSLSGHARSLLGEGASEIVARPPSPVSHPHGVLKPGFSSISRITPRFSPAVFNRGVQVTVHSMVLPRRFVAPSVTCWLSDSSA